MLGGWTLECSSDPIGRKLTVSPMPKTSPPPTLSHKRKGKGVISVVGRASGSVVPPCDVKEECDGAGPSRKVAVQRIRTTLNKVVVRTELSRESTAK